MKVERITLGRLRGSEIICEGILMRREEWGVKEGSGNGEFRGSNKRNTVSLIDFVFVDIGERNPAQSGLLETSCLSVTPEGPSKSTKSNCKSRGVNFQTELCVWCPINHEFKSTAKRVRRAMNHLTTLRSENILNETMSIWHLVKPSRSIIPSFHS